MKEDLLRRAKLATEPGPASGDLAPANPGRPPAERRTASLDRSRIDEVLARAREATRERPRPTICPAEPPAKVTSHTRPAEPRPRVAPPMGPRKVRVPMTCGATGKSFIAIAEDRGAVLRFVGHELPQHSAGGGASAPRLLGSYRFVAARDWACPLCRSRHNPTFGPYLVWQCRCSEFDGALHCAGSVGNASYCACGRFEPRQFATQKSFNVRGEQMAMAHANRQDTPHPSSPPAATQRAAPPPLPRSGPPPLSLPWKR